MSFPHHVFAQQQYAQWVAVAAHEAEDLRSHTAAQEAIQRGRNAAVLNVLSDHGCGAFNLELLARLPIKASVTNVYNTPQTRASVARKRSGDVEFIWRNVPHALAHPRAFVTDERDAERVLIIGFAQDGERMLRMVLEAPPAVQAAQGSYGWLVVSAGKFGKDKWRQALNAGRLTRV
jgi:hypothetical protein